MKNPICISTGTIYKLSNDRNEMIKILQKFKPDGIELSFAYPQYILDFQISDENLKYMQSLKFNSIHAPWKEISYSDNELCHTVLKAIENLYKQINAKNVVIHFKTDSDVSVVEGYNFVTSTENGEWYTENWPKTPDAISLILNQDDNLKFTFDFAHALTVSSNDVPIYVNRYKEKISEIHFSDRQKEAPDHWFLHKNDNEEIRKLLSHLKVLDVPVVLEGVATDESELPLIGKEMEYAREIFS